MKKLSALALCLFLAAPALADSISLPDPPSSPLCPAIFGTFQQAAAADGQTRRRLLDAAISRLDAARSAALARDEGFYCEDGPDAVQNLIVLSYDNDPAIKLKVVRTLGKFTRWITKGNSAEAMLERMLLDARALVAQGKAPPSVDASWWGDAAYAELEDIGGQIREPLRKDAGK